MERAQVVLAMEFGQGQHGHATRSNRTIAALTEQIQHNFRIPVCIQGEAALELRRLSPVPAKLEVMEHRGAGKYLDSQETLEQFAEFCLNRPEPLREALVVTHPHHQWRTMRQAARLGFIPFAADCGLVRYDKRSTQPWTRDERSFKRYEIQARLLALKRGWI